MTASRRQRNLWALSGALFAVFFIASLVLGGLLWFPASAFIPLGRLLAFVWSAAVSFVLVRGRPRSAYR